MIQEEDPQNIRLQIRLFGPISVEVEGETIPQLRSRRGLWALALLTLRANREVSRTWLAGTLWPDSDSTLGLENLRRTLTDLRRALGPAAARLLAPTSQTLLLRLTPPEADVLEFDAMIEESTPTSLESAVALYEAPLLEDCYEDWAAAEQERRREAYLKALERLAQISSEEAGASARTIRYLRLVVAVDPSRESLSGQLMHTLAKSGDSAAAEEVYRQLQFYLHKELNTEPSADITALYERIREEARKRHAGTPPIGTSLSPQAAQRGAIPTALTTLVGRDQAVSTILETLQQARLVTLTGPGGIGKTRLAMQVAQQATGSYEAGVWFVDLAPITDALLLPNVVATALGLQEQPHCPLLDSLIEHLAAKSLLLVLDNCEHLLQECACFAAALLQADPALRILATSQQALGITGETVWGVPALELPPLSFTMGMGQEDASDTLLRYPALRLFYERAHEVSPSFTITARGLQATADICHRLDGIPLAIELAAARAKFLSLEQIAARLEDRFRLLTGGSRNALPRQQTLRATVDWSYDLLEEAERRVFRRLSVFHGSFPLERAEALCTDTSESAAAQQESVGEAQHIATWDVMELLAQLVNKSLVLVEQTPEGEYRYRLLATIRAYAQERLKEAGEWERLRLAHRDCFLQLALQAAAATSAPEREVWFQRMESEHDNLRAALEASFAHPEEEEESLRLLIAMYPFWMMHSHFREGRTWMELALAQIPGGDPTLRTKVLNAAGNFCLILGDYAAAQRYYNQNLIMARENAIPNGIAISLQNLGLVAFHQGEYALARTLQEESLTLVREQGDPDTIAQVLNNLALVAKNSGDYPYAHTLLEESYAIYRKMQNLRGMAIALTTKSGLSTRQGDYAASNRMLQESLVLYREVKDRQGTAIALNNLGEVCILQGDYAQAGAYNRESLAISRELENRREIATTLCNMGQLAHLQGDLAEARSCFHESLEMAVAMNDRVLILALLTSIAHMESKSKTAVRLLGAVATARERFSLPIEAYHKSDYDRKLQARKETLNAEQFATAWAEGQSLTLDQAISLALEQ